MSAARSESNVKLCTFCGIRLSMDKHEPGCQALLSDLDRLKAVVEEEIEEIQLVLKTEANDSLISAHLGSVNALKWVLERIEEIRGEG